MSSKSTQWTKNPEYIQLLNFLIEKTKIVEKPLRLKQLAREFKKQSSFPLSINGLWVRIRSLRPKIHAIKIDTETKVKMLFALSACVDTDFLEKLKEHADVALDGHNRIIEYKTKGGEGLQLKGTHVTKNGWDKVIRRDESMLEFLAQKTTNLDSPILIQTFVRQFKETTGAKERINHLNDRFKFIRSKIHESARFDQTTKLRMLFVSSASVPNSFLAILRKDALVEVDDNSRITRYRANDGSLELTGDHSQSAKLAAGWAESRRRNREAKKSAEPNNDVESEEDSDESSSEARTYNRNMNSEADENEAENIEEQVTTRSGRVSKKRVSDFDFVMHESEDDEALPFQTSKKSSSAAPTSSEKIRNPETERSSSSKRAKPASDDFMRPDELDDYDPNYSFHRTDQNSIKAPAEIRGNEADVQEIGGSFQKMNQSSRSSSEKSSSPASTSINPELTEEKRKTDTKQQTADDYMEQDDLNDCDSNYSFHRTNENLIEASEKTVENEEDEQKIGGLNRKINQSSEEPASSKKKRKTDTEGFNTSKRAHPDGFMRTDELHDSDLNQSTDDSSRIELKPFRGSLLDNEHLNPMDDDIQVLERPPAPAPKDIEMIEAPIKTEEPITPKQGEMSGKIKNPVEEEVKPKFTSQLKLLEVIKSLVDTLDTASLSQIRLKTCLKIWKIGKSDKKIPNELMTAAMELLFVRIANDSVSNLSGTVESVGLVHFMCYLKAAIWSSKLDGLDSLLEKITRRSKDQASMNKSIPVEKVAIVLQATLDVIGF